MQGRENEAKQHTLRDTTIIHGARRRERGTRGTIIHGHQSIDFFLQAARRLNARSENIADKKRSNDATTMMRVFVAH